MGQIHEAKVTLSTVIAGTLATVSIIGGIAIGAKEIETRWGVLVVLVAAVAHAMFIRQWLECYRDRERQMFQLGRESAGGGPDVPRLR